MVNSVDVEQPDALLRYLRGTGRIEGDETPAIVVLKGGVSNRTVLVERSSGEAWVIKQALPKLRVAEEWFSDPARIHRETLGLRWLEQLAPPGSVPRFVFEDHEQHLLAMHAVPQPHENWKTRLLAGVVEAERVRQFGELLGTIHGRSREQCEQLYRIFADRTFFETLRLEPYYRFAAARNPGVAGFLAALIDETLAARLTLVHGDYSPKNVLLYQDRLVLLDHEVIHFGDPAFDLSFGLTHLLSKANHLPPHREEFLHAAQWFWTAYQEKAGELARWPGLEPRAVRHTLACLLARVDGRSPLEYLTATEQQRQRAAVVSLMRQPPSSLPDLFDAFAAQLNR